MPGLTWHPVFSWIPVFVGMALIGMFNCRIAICNLSQIPTAGFLACSPLPSSKFSVKRLPRQFAVSRSVGAVGFFPAHDLLYPFEHLYLC